MQTVLVLEKDGGYLMGVSYARGGELPMYYMDSDLGMARVFYTLAEARRVNKGFKGKIRSVHIGKDGRMYAA